MVEGKNGARLDRVKGMSYLIFRPKPNIHGMCAQQHLFHTYRQKCSQ
jgi:hypothetical protein